jgi:benzoate-CoA ligase
MDRGFFCIGTELGRENINLRSDAANAATELLAGNLELHPHKTAYFCAGKALSYRELERGCRRFARLLQKEGIVPQERVAVALPDSLAFPVVFLGCILSGAVAVVVSPDLGEAELAHVIDDCGAAILVTLGEPALPSSAMGKGVKLVICDDRGEAEGCADCDDFGAPYVPSAGDFAYMLFSSGSTGRVKGVPHRHESLLLPCDLVGKEILGITGDDLIFSTSKFPFAYGLINSLAFPLRFGATALLHPGRPEPLALLDIIRTYRPSIFFSVPTLFAQILLSSGERELELPMRICCSAGEALPAPLFEEWQRLTGLEILDGIGSTEMAYHFISNLPGRAVAGSAGRLVPGYRARLVDVDGNDVSGGEEGNLLIAGPTRTPCYWNRPEKSAETFLPDGFMKSGDIFAERDGFYYYRGRSDDMIKSGSCWVSPSMVEAALLSHPAVAECAVAAVKVGAFHRPGAFVVPAPGMEQGPRLARELKKHIMARLPDYMCPVRFRFMERLPRTSTGKIQRFMLREEANDVMRGDYLPQAK